MLLDYQDEDTRTWVVRCVDDESGDRMDLTGANLHLLMTSLVEGTCTLGAGHWQIDDTARGHATYTWSAQEKLTSFGLLLLRVRAISLQDGVPLVRLSAPTVLYRGSTDAEFMRSVREAWDYPLAKWVVDYRRGPDHAWHTVKGFHSATAAQEYRRTLGRELLGEGYVFAELAERPQDLPPPAAAPDAPRS
jgi:hypothetical protein